MSGAEFDSIRDSFSYDGNSENVDNEGLRTSHKEPEEVSPPVKLFNDKDRRTEASSREETNVPVVIEVKPQKELDEYDFVDENESRFVKFEVDIDLIEGMTLEDILDLLSDFFVQNGEKKAYSMIEYREKLFFIMRGAKKSEFWREVERRGIVQQVLLAIAHSAEYKDATIHVVALLLLYSGILRMSKVAYSLLETVFKFLHSTLVLFSSPFDYDVSFSQFIKVYSGLSVPDPPSSLIFLVLDQILRKTPETLLIFIESGCANVILGSIHNHANSLRWMEETQLVLVTRILDICFALDFPSFQESELVRTDDLIQDIISIVADTAASIERKSKKTEKQLSIEHKILVHALNILMKTTDENEEAIVQFQQDDIQNLFSVFVKMTKGLFLKNSMKGTLFESTMQLLSVLINLMEVSLRARQQFSLLVVEEESLRIAEEYNAGEALSGSSKKRRRTNTIEALDYLTTFFTKCDDNCSIENEENRSVEDNIACSLSAVVLGLLSKESMANRVYIRRRLRRNNYDAVLRALLEFVGMHSRADTLSPNMFRVVNEIIDELKPKKEFLRRED